ncbi:histone chaperone RTT106-like [Pyrus ussuriensis x Pyrus communis]|uniref:Histone chaperone RTT106-like n=1 Tax=Pyrus ussuriensis x Pyrus communis TaxID=2448454 RepID=A0A5N5HQR5_9ROSA|nr:histone chaperone RTT106-like [Pyrus ussuriensis x Pyrus communis]
MKPSLTMGWEKRRIEVGETPLYSVIIEDIEESRVAISITKGSGSKLKKGRAKRGADDLEKRLCLLNDIAYNGDDEHEAEATEGGQGSRYEAEDGPLNADNEGDETEEGYEAEEPCTQEAPQPSSQPTQVSQTTSKSIARGQKMRRNVP